MNYKFISCYLIKTIFRRTHENNKDSLNILPTDMVKILLEFFIPSDDTMDNFSIGLFHYLRLNFQSPKFKQYLLTDRDDKLFKCSYLLKRDDEMFLRYSATQQTIGQIIESQKIKDTISWDELQQGYGLIIFQSNNFLHSKEYYIKIAKTLPHMMLETLFICSCHNIFENHFCNHFDCYIPFHQDDTLNIFTPKRSNKVNFNNLNELITHVTKFKCNRHKILGKYLQHYIVLKMTDQF